MIFFKILFLLSVLFQTSSVFAGAEAARVASLFARGHVPREGELVISRFWTCRFFSALRNDESFLDNLDMRVYENGGRVDTLIIKGLVGQDFYQDNFARKNGLLVAEKPSFKHLSKYIYLRKYDSSLLFETAVSTQGAPLSLLNQTEDAISNKDFRAVGYQECMPYQGPYVPTQSANPAKRKADEAQPSAAAAGPGERSKSFRPAPQDPKKLSFVIFPFRPSNCNLEDQIRSFTLAQGTQIESLQFPTVWSAEDLAKILSHFPRLRNLKIYAVDSSTTALINPLADLKNLEYLDIPFDFLANRGLNGSGRVTLVVNYLKNLSTLNHLRLNASDATNQNAMKKGGMLNKAASVYADLIRTSSITSLDLGDVYLGLADNANSLALRDAVVHNKRLKRIRLGLDTKPKLNGQEEWILKTLIEGNDSLEVLEIVYTLQEPMLSQYISTLKPKNPNLNIFKIKY